MKTQFFFVAVLSVISMSQLKAESPVQDQYLGCYVAIHDGEKAEKNKDYLDALIHFKIAATYLQSYRDADPSWESDLITRRLKDCQDAITRLQPLAEQQVKESYPLGLTEPALDGIKNDALQNEKNNNPLSALKLFVKYLTILEVMKQSDPSQKAAFAEKEIADVRSKADQLAQLILKEYANNNNGGKPVQ